MTFKEWRERVRALRARLTKRAELISYWKQRAHDAEDMLAQGIILPGRREWKPQVERWRSIVHYWMGHFGGDRYRQNPDRLLDLMLGVMEYESGGEPLAVSRVEWIGDPPPGYDGTVATRASGLFQHVPAWWPSRSKAAGFADRSIFDVNANVATACWLLWDGWHPETAPNWRHWSAAHVGKEGSYEWAVKQLADDYGEEP